VISTRVDKNLTKVDFYILNRTEWHHLKIIHHKDRPAIKFPEEHWRPTLRPAINRSAGAETLSSEFRVQSRAAFQMDSCGLNVLGFSQHELSSSESD